MHRYSSTSENHTLLFLVPWQLIWRKTNKQTKKPFSYYFHSVHPWIIKKKKIKNTPNQSVSRLKYSLIPFLTVDLATSSQLNRRRRIGCSLRPSAAERVEIHLHLLSAAQHANGGVESSSRHHHLPPPNDLPVAGEEHLGGDSESHFCSHGTWDAGSYTSCFS